MDWILMLLAFGITLIVTRALIPYLTRLKFGQTVRADGPESHLKKTGTPTMGGIGFILGITVSFLALIIIQVMDVFASERVALPIEHVGFVGVSLLGFAGIGFIDDYLKVVKKSPDGFKAKHKLLCQVVMAGVLLTYLVIRVGTSIYIPFSGDQFIDLSYFYIPFVLIVILGTVNGVNLTDGVDGLATMVTIVVAVYYALSEFLTGGGLGVLAWIVIGSLAAFLIFNRYPAKVFMGDTGSLALGGFVVAMALIQRNPLVIVAIGIIYLVENLSVMIQVGVYKRTKKRVFLMAPLHHHFELKGLTEWQIVMWFTGITIVMVGLAVLAIL